MTVIPESGYNARCVLHRERPIGYNKIDPSRTHVRKRMLCRCYFVFKYYFIIFRKYNKYNIVNLSTEYNILILLNYSDIVCTYMNNWLLIIEILFYCDYFVYTSRKIHTTYI